MADRSFERKCVVVTKQSKFYVPEDISTTDKDTSNFLNSSLHDDKEDTAAGSSASNCRHSIYCTLSKYLYTCGKLVLVLLYLFLVLKVLLEASSDSLQLNLAFIMVGVSVGVALSYLASGYFLTSKSKTE